MSVNFSILKASGILPLFLLLILPGCHVLHYPTRWDPGETPSIPLPTATPPPKTTDNTPSGKKPPEKIKDTAEDSMLEFARSLLGSRAPLVVNGHTFRYDCSGFVSAVYYKAGIDITAASPDRIRKGMSGTEIIYQWTLENGTVFTKKPQPGDLVFFDNTYDRNKNRKLDDKFTHIGIVDQILPSGTIEVLHLGNAGIGRIRMNLAHPTVYRNEETGELLNHKLRRQLKTDPTKTRYLAAQLFRTFGRKN